MVINEHLFWVRGVACERRGTENVALHDRWVFQWLRLGRVGIYGPVLGMNTWKDVATWNNNVSPSAEAGPDALLAGGTVVDSLFRWFKVGNRRCGLLRR